MSQDLLHAYRSLRRAPGYAVLVALTLALGIGANSAIANVAWQVLLAPLPFPDESRLVMVWEGFGEDRVKNPSAPASFLDWQREARSFASIAAFNRYRSALNLTEAGEPRELDITHVTADFFTVLGLSAVAGRPILPTDAQHDGNVLVLSQRLWRQAFGADPSVVGRTVRLHGEPFEIIGVMPDTASLGFAPTDGWVRLPLRGEQAQMRQAHFLQVVARLRPGVSLASADDDVRRISERSFAQFGGAGVAESARVTSFRDELTSGVRPAVVALLAFAALVLLIAAANVSGLQLARQIRRRRDIAIQAALGASRARQARLQLAEALLIAVPAAGAGLILGAWVLVGVAAAAPALISLQLQTSPGPVVAAYTFGLSVAAALACALGSFWSLRASPQPLLASRGATQARGAARFRSVLVAFQVGLSVLVLVGAALLVSSLVRVLSVDPGFDFERGLVVNVDLPANTYADGAVRSRFFQAAVERLSAVPGAEGACAMTSAPFVQRGGNMTWVREGATRMVGSQTSSMTPECFSVLRIPVLRGRTFAVHEPESVVVVSRSLARQMFRDEDPLGRRIHMGLPNGPVHTIVGVVGDIRRASLESGYANQVWVPASGPLYPPRQMIVRTAVPPESLAGAVRAAIREIDPNLPVTKVATMEEIKGETLAERRFNMLLLVTYGAIGLALCGVGVYGLLSEVVGQRTREIGVRMALGARPLQVVRAILVGTLTTVIAGSVMGVGAAVLLSKYVRTLLFEVSPTEPSIYAVVVGVVLAVALLAACVPALRAIRVDPLEALRAE